MTFEPVEGGRYFIHVDQDTLSVYVSWQLNDVIRIDDEEPYTFYRFPRENRLTQVTYPDGTQTLYQYNKKNNMVSTTTITETATETTDMTYDIENRLLQSGATLYEYDNNGNMIAGSTAYRYYSTYLDGYKVNWLVGVGTTGGGPINPTSSNGNTIMSAPAETTADTTPATSYGYALDGRRVGKAGAVDMKYLYDGENVIYELWDDKLVRFTHPVKSGSCGSCGSCGDTGSIFFTDHPISITIYDENGIPTKYYYLYDGLGSVTELIDADENVVNYYRYTPFGDALIREEQIYNPHQFTGRQYDAESGLYHYRARAYSTEVGRFLQQDPAGMVDGANMYAYVGNNPVNGVDSSGKASFASCLAYAGTIGYASIHYAQYCLYWETGDGKGLPQYSSRGTSGDPKWHCWRAHFYTGCMMARFGCDRFATWIIASVWEPIEKAWQNDQDGPKEDIRSVLWGHYYSVRNLGTNCHTLTTSKIPIRYNNNWPSTGYTSFSWTSGTTKPNAYYEEPLYNISGSPAWYPGV